MALTLLHAVLAGLALFFAKHFVVDFVLQDRYQLDNKGRYGHPGGLLHSGLHALFSLPAVLVFRPPLWAALLVCGAEFLTHYHMDWAKDQVVKRYGWSTSNKAYWQAFGFDQFVHALTYIAMTAWLASHVESSLAWRG